MSDRPSPLRRTNARLPIEEADCALLDLALAASFEGRELENLLGADPNPEAHPERGPLAQAHRAAHQGGAVARRLEAVLDLLHREALTAFEDRAHPAELLAEAIDADLWRRPDLGGLAWAVARSTDPEVARLRPCFARILSLDAFRALAGRAAPGA